MIFKGTSLYDEYETMTEKLLTLHDCTATDFVSGTFRNVDGVYELV